MSPLKNGMPAFCPDCILDGFKVPLKVIRKNIDLNERTPGEEVAVECPRCEGCMVRNPRPGEPGKWNYQVTDDPRKVEK